MASRFRPAACSTRIVPSPRLTPSTAHVTDQLSRTQLTCLPGLFSPPEAGREQEWGLLCAVHLPKPLWQSPCSGGHWAAGAGGLDWRSRAPPGGGRLPLCRPPRVGGVQASWRGRTRDTDSADPGHLLKQPRSGAVSPSQPRGNHACAQEEGLSRPQRHRLSARPNGFHRGRTHQ